MAHGGHAAVGKDGDEDQRCVEKKTAKSVVWRDKHDL
jgi:hypothetical protein